jgi:hypothetical protein
MYYTTKMNLCDLIPKEMAWKTEEKVLVLGRKQSGLLVLGRKLRRKELGLGRKQRRRVLGLGRKQRRRVLFLGRRIQKMSEQVIVV